MNTKKCMDCERILPVEDFFQNYEKKGHGYLSVANRCHDCMLKFRARNLCKKAGKYSSTQIPTSSKVCKLCGKAQPLSEYKRVNGEKGEVAICRVCRKTKSDYYYQRTYGKNEASATAETVKDKSFSLVLNADGSVTWKTV
jgi:hypothetical protein